MPKPKEMSSWDMACSITVAMDQAYEKAHSEYLEAHNKANGDPFAQGVSAPRILRDALGEAIRTLKPELHKIGKANGLPLPVREGQNS